MYRLMVSNGFVDIHGLLGIYGSFICSEKTNTLLTAGKNAMR